MSSYPAPPAPALALTELPRAGIESVTLAFRLSHLVRANKGGDRHPVLVLSGYGGADGSTAILRYFLKQIGYCPFALNLGRNLESSAERIKSVDDATRFRNNMTDAVVDRIESIHEQTGQPVSLLGWSMGGLYALDASHRVPTKTRQVITLGTPFGDPRGTSLFNLMRRFSGSTVPIDNQDFSGWLSKAHSSGVPTRVIYSSKDGIVGVDVAKLPAGEQLEQTQVNSSHIGFTVNPGVLQVVADALNNMQKENSTKKTRATRYHRQANA